ncbi:AbrB/MazE/SpoVT family DNA-binding domain-containing protein [Brasilonema octagenarum]|jgi:bifunctional DNA-binding transcriptional regulator/antitoxin component of YhaV-PrlF toxin-antitoxin module|uniref:AbrB/MazE/SpoVT family DNA-binding domain-containing protein n=1 Tax=Brasilonema octagenarum UFV-OR1 TaxID=417115 RepID=A0ABX1MI25_9CYAN|nr:AbrB/MazE/SpoVT family DNA-binding domain-containing protein [Brasilonema octagenarum]NMF67465.1 AbrB/MazE/SpoVT family DNA-binding domain-containing protein [Brasilonema octagenarum UFV-OR1]
MDITIINTDGHIAIPPNIQEQLGLLPGTAIQLEVIGDTLHLRKQPTSSQGAQLIAAIRGKATRELRTDEIMQLTRETYD